MYLASVLLFMIVLPVISIVLQNLVYKIPVDLLMAGKWFLFWGVGGRLLIAGLRQITKPAFTATEIFRIHDPASFVIVRELGFANVCFGMLGIVSLFQPAWRMPAAVAGGLYFGLAGLLHVVKKPDSRNEVIALWSDLFIFLVMLAYIIAAI